MRQICQFTQAFGMEWALPSPTFGFGTSPFPGGRRGLGISVSVGAVSPVSTVAGVLCAGRTFSTRVFQRLKKVQISSSSPCVILDK